MNQFGSIYSRILCCDCGDDFKNEKCLNGTDAALNSKLSGETKYAWICGVLGLFGFTSLFVFGMIFYIKKKMAIQYRTDVSVISFKEALLGQFVRLNNSSHSLVNFEQTSQSEIIREENHVMNQDVSLHVIPPGLDSPRYMERRSPYKSEFHLLVESPCHSEDNA